MQDNYQEKQQLQSEQKETEPHHLAKIGGIYEDGVSLIFTGSEEESVKHYAANEAVQFAVVMKKS